MKNIKTLLSKEKNCKTILRKENNLYFEFKCIEEKNIDTSEFILLERGKKFNLLFNNFVNKN